MRARARLASGGKLLLTVPGPHVRNYDRDPVELGFSSIFWNTAWTRRQPPTTLGILCDPKHPALDAFPTDFHTNWQWWYLLHRAGALRLDLLPQDMDPIVRVIDDWVTARPLGLVVEAKVGEGSAVICGFDLTRDADDPVSAQMRASLLHYMGTPRFRPAARVSADRIAGLLKAPRRTVLSEGSAKADSEQAGYEAALAVDGDEETFWHTAWEPESAALPHELVVDLGRTVNVTGFTALPRQDGNANGRIDAFALYLRQDGAELGAPRGHGKVPQRGGAEHGPAAETHFREFRPIGGAQWSRQWPLGVAGRT